MSVTGSILSRFSRLELSTADEKTYTLENNTLSRLALRIVGVPHLGFRMRAKIILAEARKEATKTSRILDAGCGYGLYSMTLAESGFTVDSIDLEAARTAALDTMLRESPEIKQNITIFTGSLTNLPFESSVYDLEICSEVIEHIADDKKAVSELARVLKPGGRLILSVPYNSKHNQKLYKRFAHERPGYTKKELIDLFAPYDLTIERAFYYEHRLGSVLFEIFNKITAKPLMGILFYPLYALYLLDHYMGWGEPNQIVVSAQKNA